MTSPENNNSAQTPATKPSEDFPGQGPSNGESVKPATEHEFTPLTGSCHCGLLTYTVSSAPLYQGLCYCRDCQRLSGSAFLPWLVIPSSSFKLTVRDGSEASAVKQICGTSARGSEKVLSICAECGSCVFGGRYGHEVQHTVYAGTLSDSCVNKFEPSMAIFVRDRPAWAKVEGLREFDGMPGGGGEDNKGS